MDGDAQVGGAAGQRGAGEQRAPEQRVSVGAARAGPLIWLVAV